ncbi:HEPN domain-containing protein [Orrella sp. JC864]|uniref:HEPN domain-containing protein n=1 Tax=Orrella sp. JC864 TaxID=3120298 RepID=UPI003009950A
MSSSDLMVKAKRAAMSAQSLLDDGDPDGAVNRAYYAMFDAAKAALISAGVPQGKTHKGTLAAFSEHFVKTGIISTETGRSLKWAETVRLAADYSDESVDLDTAQKIVQETERFISVVERKIKLPQEQRNSEPRRPGP